MELEIRIEKITNGWLVTYTDKYHLNKKIFCSNTTNLMERIGWISQKLEDE